MVRQPHHMLYAGLLRDFAGAVAAAIIDYQVLNIIDTCYLTG
jgi:hypothetical protein